MYLDYMHDYIRLMSTAYRLPFVAFDITRETPAAVIPFVRPPLLPVFQPLPSAISVVPPAVALPTPR